MARTRKTPIYPIGKPDNGTVDSSDSPTTPPRVDVPTREQVQPTRARLPRQAAQSSTPPTGEDRTKNKKSARKMASPAGPANSRAQRPLGIKPALKRTTDKIPITKEKVEVKEIFGKKYLGFNPPTFKLPPAPSTPPEETGQVAYSPAYQPTSPAYETNTVDFPTHETARGYRLPEDPTGSVFNAQEKEMLLHLQAKLDAYNAAHPPALDPPATPKTTPPKRAASHELVAPPAIRPRVAGLKTTGLDSETVPPPKERAASHELVAPAASQEPVPAAAYRRRVADDDEESSKKSPSVASDNDDKSPSVASDNDDDNLRESEQKNPDSNAASEEEDLDEDESGHASNDESYKNDEESVESESAPTAPTRDRVASSTAPTRERARFPVARNRARYRARARAPVPKPAYGSRIQGLERVVEDLTGTPTVQVKTEEFTFDLTTLDEEEEEIHIDLPELRPGDLESYDQLHKEFVRIAAMKKPYFLPAKDNPPGGNKYDSHEKRGQDSSIRRAYACLLALHYAQGEIPVDIQGRKKLYEFMTTDEQLTKTREILLRIEPNDTAALVPEKNYPHDTPHYFMYQYNMAGAVMKFKGPYKKKGYAYWKSKEFFKQTPEHPHIHYKKFFEILSQGRHPVL